MTIQNMKQEETPIVFEPDFQDENCIDMKCLTQIVCDHPELAELVESWFEENYWKLSEHEQAAIQQLLSWKG